MELIGFDPPQIDADEILTILRDTYGLTGATARLRGERSHNTLITTTGGERVVLKVASASEPIDSIRMHGEALAHLACRAPDLPVARMIRSLDRELVPVLHRSGRAHAMRLVTHLPGMTYGDDAPISIDGLRSIGALIGASRPGWPTSSIRPPPTSWHGTSRTVSYSMTNYGAAWARMPPACSARSDHDLQPPST